LSKSNQNWLSIHSANLKPVLLAIEARSCCAVVYTDCCRWKTNKKYYVFILKQKYYILWRWILYTYTKQWAGDF